MIPLYRRQLVSTRQMQLIQPEVKELQRKYKGDRVKQQAATQEYYRQRGINPAGGCLPIILQFGLLIPMYSVISQGLTNYDPSAMWHVFGFNLFPGIVCPTAPEFNSAGHVINAVPQPGRRGPVPVGPAGARDHRLVRSPASGSASSRSSRRCSRSSRRG